MIVYVPIVLTSSRVLARLMTYCAVLMRLVMLVLSELN